MGHVTSNLPQRFWDKVDRGATTDACWLWTASKSAGGYGQFRLGRTRSAHRVAYEALVGPIPNGLEIDHLCRVRHCVNPAHLEPVTHRENGLRGEAGEVAAAIQRNKTHCPQGHPYDDANTYRPPRGERQCRTCNRESSRRWSARRRS